jgi:soluble lytic murein transglycosylase-like protein
VKRLFFVIAGLMLSVPAHAEIAVLANGMTLKVAARRREGAMVFLTLKDGGEVGAPVSFVRGFVPDEVLDEIAAAPNASTGLPGTDIRSLAIAAAKRHGLDPDLVLAVVSVESNFRSDAVSPKGAQGLMQLMPRTARELGVLQPLDAADNLDGGARYLKALLAQYGGNREKALAAYNAGPGAVARHKGVPPYKETLVYVKKVLARAQKGK